MRRKIAFSGPSPSSSAKRASTAGRQSGVIGVSIMARSRNRSESGPSGSDHRKSSAQIQKDRGCSPTGCAAGSGPPHRLLAPIACRPMPPGARGMTQGPRPRPPRPLAGGGMAVGTVKWFNSTKGYGFIRPEDGGADVFVHVTAVQRAGLHSLMEGQRVTYEVVRDRGKLAAANLSPAE